MTVHHLNASDLPRLLCDLREELESRRDVVFAYVFGSVLQAAGFRDVDVAIWTAPGAAPDVDLEVGVALASRTGLPIDVRRINDAPGSFLFQVLRGRPLVVHDERLLADLIERTARTQHDLAAIRRRAVKEAFVA